MFFLVLEVEPRSSYWATSLAHFYFLFCDSLSGCSHWASTSALLPHRLGALGSQAGLTMPSWFYVLNLCSLNIVIFECLGRNCSLKGGLFLNNSFPRSTPFICTLTSLSHLILMNCALTSVFLDQWWQTCGTHATVNCWSVETSKKFCHRCPGLSHSWIWGWPSPSFLRHQYKLFTGICTFSVKTLEWGFCLGFPSSSFWCFSCVPFLWEIESIK